MTMVLRAICFLTLVLIAPLLTASEPSVGVNGWTNIPGVVEGTMTARPIDMTLPTPPLGYVEYLPLGYDAANKSVKWPLIVYLVGLGEAGDGTNNAANNYQLYNKCVYAHGPLQQVVYQNWDYPAIVVSVQDTVNWNSTNAIHSMMLYLYQNYNVDMNRISITGLCDGASGALRYAAAYPGDIAAVFPTEAGVPPLAGQAATLANVPMWLLHDFCDPETTVRGNSIQWMDGATAADVGSSNCMASYPSYGTPYSATVQHYAVAADPITGFPIDMADGISYSFSGCSLTNGSKLGGTPNFNLGSTTYYQLTGSEAAPFCQANIASSGATTPDSWAKSGVMIRDSTAAGSKMVVVCQVPDNQVTMQWRDSDNGGANWIGTSLGSTATVKYVQLTNSNGTFTGSYSADGINWTVLGSVFIPFDNTAYTAGLALSSHNGNYYQQTFENVSLSGALSPALTDMDIGTGDLTGSGSFNAPTSTYTLLGGGGDIWNNADQCNYDYTSVTGNQTISALVGVNEPVYNVQITYPTSFFYTKPFVGPTASGTLNLNFQTPLGYNCTGYYDNASGQWIWEASNSWDTTRPSKHIFTMDWYQGHVQGGDEEYAVADVYNWALSQCKLNQPQLSIVTQPSPATVAIGTTATFTVSASSSLPITYQWFENGVAIRGATASTLVTAPTGNADINALISCVAANDLGDVSSSAVKLSVYYPVPSFTSSPQSVTVAYGQSATFSAGIVAAPPITYQWLLNGFAIGGATGPTYVTPPASVASNGDQYSLEIQDPGGSATSPQAATLSVTLLPVIYAQPLATSVPDGQVASFSVVAFGAPTLTYQWYQDSAAITGANASSYSLTAPYTLNGAQISVVVGNGYGSAPSIPATLTVAPVVPAILAQPQDATVQAGQSATYSVTASGTGPLSYQWQQAGTFGFVDQDIGGVAFPGSFASVQGAVTMTASGTDIWNNADAFNFAYRQLTGDGSITALVTSLANDNPWAKAGVMFRSSLDPSSPFVDICYAPQGLVSFQERETYNGQCNYTAQGINNPVWVRLTRAGSLFSGYYSSDGVNWSFSGSDTVQMGATVYVGLCACSHDNSQITTATLTNVTTSLSTGTQNSYTTQATTIAASGTSYDVLVSNGAGSVTSTVANLTVTYPPPAIMTAPTNQTATDGGTATFSVVACSPLPITYQWYLSGILVPGATSTSFALTTPYALNGGTVNVVATNSIGSTVSGSALLTVTPVSPVISIPPANVIVSDGQMAHFSAAATGTAPISFQWYSGTNPIVGANQTTLSMLGSYALTGTQISVVATNIAGSSALATAILTVTPVAPVIVTVPASTSVSIGLSATFSATASGTAPLSYQWNLGGIPITDANSPALSVDSTQATSGSQYSVTVTNLVSSVTSAAATLTIVGQPPSIVTQPTSQSAPDGGTATFSVIATSTLPITYQWYVSATPVSGATSSSVSITTPYALNGANVNVVVSNDNGNTPSNSATLTVMPVAPTITMPPASITVGDGLTAAFSVTAIGTGPFAYQWYQGASAIAGATLPTYSLTAPYALTGAQISVVVSNLAGSTPSGAATLTVLPTPVTIVSAPANVNVSIGQSATFTVVATGSPPLSYQWNMAGVPIIGAISSSLGVTASNTIGTATYSVTVTNPAGPVTSSIATLNASEAEPSISDNGWTNIPNVVQGVINVHPINATTPTPPFGYVEYLPLGYSAADTTVAWPLVIYLHNVNEAGDGTNTAANGNQLYNNMITDGPLYQVTTCNWDFPAIIIAPQQSTSWSSNFTKLKAMLTYIEANYRVDTNRIYMTGMVDGAAGVMRYAYAYPTDLAAVLPIEVNFSPTTAQAAATANLPMWFSHCFADLGLSSRSCSINWIDLATNAQYGGISNSMGTYPSYGGVGNPNHYACATASNGKPLTPLGPTITIPSATMTNGSKVITFPGSLGSSVYLMLSGSDALPFTQIQVAGDAPTYTSMITYGASGYFTDPYLGTSGVKNLTISLPVGYNLTASRSTAGVWNWESNQVWDQAQPSNRLFTLFYYEAQQPGWQQTWNNATCWNWLFSQVK